MKSSLAQYQARGTKTSLLIVSVLIAVQMLSANTLQENNPFLPPGFNDKKPEPPKPVVVDNGPLARELEFRGITQFDGIKQYSVFNRSEQKAYWLREDEMKGGMKVSGYDAKKRSITVVKNGRTENITLMSASSRPVPVATSVTMPNSNKNPKLPQITSLPNNVQKDTTSKTVPRRRVILPKK